MIFLNGLVANHKKEKNLEHCPLLIHIAIWENVYMTWNIFEILMVGYYIVWRR